MRKRPRNSITRKKAVKAGFRSGLEQNVSKVLSDNSIAVQYEPFKLEYTTSSNTKGVTCSECGCGDIKSVKKYLPDFVVEGTKIILEPKGEFDFRDRNKQIEVQKQNPEWDIIILFQRPQQKISPKSSYTYGTWATANGLRWYKASDTHGWVEYIKKALANK